MEKRIEIDLNQVPSFPDSSESEAESEGGSESESESSQSESGAETESQSESESESESEKVEEKVEEKEQKEDRKARVKQYGNCRGYYKNRNGSTTPEDDSRLQFLRNEWFEDKECLDIGSNDGTLIIAIAKRFRCKDILGVDIDPELVEKANKKLRKAAKSEMQIGESSKTLIDVVTFKQENFMEAQHPELYDTVTCFSVTLWIHLNYGDKGILEFFYKIWEVLRPGGVLILEPQPWKSYVLKKDVSPITAEKFKEIIVRPQFFQNVLLTGMGFKTVEHINPGWLEAKFRYNRPILVFKKCDNH